MELILEISEFILIVGGAICILLLLITLLYILSIIIKTKRFVNKVVHTYQQAMLVAALPIKKITDWFLDDAKSCSGDEDEEDR